MEKNKTDTCLFSILFKGLLGTHIEIFVMILRMIHHLFDDLLEFLWPPLVIVCDVYISRTSRIHQIDSIEQKQRVTKNQENNNKTKTQQRYLDGRVQFHSLLTGLNSILLSNVLEHSRTGHTRWFKQSWEEANRRRMEHLFVLSNVLKYTS